MFLEETYQDRILELLHDELKIDTDTLGALYSYFRNSAEKNDQRLEEKYTAYPGHQLNKEILEVAAGKCSYGIDLPVWFSESDKERKKIFLMAMDPLRGIDESEDATFNTPFSVHLGRKNNYYSSIKSLSDKFNIYVTDVFKLFYREKENKKSVSNASKEFTQLPIHSRIIKREIAIFEPDLILCLGNHAFSGLNQLQPLSPAYVAREGGLTQYNFTADNGTIPAFTIPHPSGVASRWAKQFLKKNKPELLYDPKTYLSDSVDLIIEFMTTKPRL